MGSTFSVPQPASLRSLATLGAMLVVLRLARRYILHQPNLPYPPGPKPLPLLGNIFDLTREKEVEAYAKVAEKYGMCYLMHTYTFSNLTPLAPQETLCF